MTQQTYSGGPDHPGTHPHDDSPPTQVARDQASEVGQSAADAGRHVAGTAKEQAGEVARETRRQAGDLLDQARRQAKDQAKGGQQQAVQGLRSLAGELNRMADGGNDRGPLSDLTEQAAGRVHDLAGWLDRREPGDLVEEVRRLARRRPGAFLVGAAIAGVLAGRLTRGAVDAARDTDSGPSADVTTPLPAVRADVPPPMPAPYPGETLPPAAPRPYPGDAAPAPYPGDLPPAGHRPAPYPGDAPPPPVVPPVTRPDGTTVGEYVGDPRHQPGGPR